MDALLSTHLMSVTSVDLCTVDYSICLRLTCGIQRDAVCQFSLPVSWEFIPLSCFCLHVLICFVYVFNRLWARALIRHEASVVVLAVVY